MAHGKLAQLRWGAFDNFEEYQADATLRAAWIEEGTAAELALADAVIGTDQKYDLLRSMKLAISNTSGSTQKYMIRRTFTGLAASTQYSIEVRLRKSAAVGTPVLWSNGEINMADPGVGAWGLSGVLTATTDSSGNLPVRLEVRTVLTTESVTYWFDEVRIWRTIAIGWPLEAPISYSVPKPGFRRVRSLFVDDVWDEGHDQILRARVRWIPPTTLAAPVATGWNASGGWRQFLEFARGGHVWQFVPDKDVATYYNMRLIEPMSEPPFIEVDVTRTLELVARTIDDTPVDVY